jgi:PAS domain S-box-containing protein
MILLLGVAVQTAIRIINADAFKKLKESEEGYRLLADHITDVIWNLNLDELKFLYASPSVEAMQGYTPEEILDLRLEDYLTLESLEIAIDAHTEELAETIRKVLDPK